jgi:hypothetical protein
MRGRKRSEATLIMSATWTRFSSDGDKKDFHNRKMVCAMENKKKKLRKGMKVKTVRSRNFHL